MAKLKVELEHEHHRRNGSTRRERLFRDIDRYAALGSRLAPLSNLLPKLPGARRVLEATLGVARERALPSFRRTSFVDWAAGRDPGVPRQEADRRVVVFPDTYTNYSEPAIGKAAVRVLEATGAHVHVPDIGPSGRAAHSLGFLDTARERARAVVSALEPRVTDGWDVVAIEPSDAVMLQSDYRDLLGDDADPLAANTYGICEYLDVHRLLDGVAFDATGETLTYHGHCHQTAVGRESHAAAVLADAGYGVDELDSGCCGMAGSFGYEREHYSMSQAIGSILFDQVAASPGERVVAPGASCRTQLADREGGERPDHPVECLADALVAPDRQS